MPSPTSDPPGMSAAPQYRFCLERIALDTGIAVDGWAFHDAHGACRLYLLADGKPLAGARARLGLPRQDVALAFANPLAAAAGFRLAGHLPAAARSVTLVFEGPGGIGHLPVLERTGPGPRDWFIPASPAPAQPDYRFLTDQGPCFAATLVGGGRLGATLALFGDTPLPPPPTAPVSIVVPVYGGKPYLHALARTLLECTHPRHPLIFVDDGNADRTVSAFLIALRAAHDHVTVVQMPGNTGYVRATAAGVAQALRRNPEGHVVVVNSDVEVPAGWVERLVAPLAAPNVASATPFANSGTICGFPMMPDDNAAFLGAGVDALDAAFATLRTSPVEIPTGVGFCMAFSRRALGAVGFFDAAAFGRGYGEEVDWCRRARAQGFVNVLVPNLFVRHKHGGSFAAAEKTAALARSGDIIRERYPDFDAEVQDFLAADPVAPLRAAAVVRLWSRLGGPGAVLVFDHGDKGGAVIVRRREVARLLEEGRLVVLVRPTAVTRPDMPEAALDIDLLHRDARFHLPVQDREDLTALAAVLPFAEILVNSLVGFERLADLLAFIVTQRRTRGTPVRMLHNDYFPLCPSFNLIDAEDRYCAIPAPERCAACLPRNRHARRDGASGDVAKHRHAWAELFAVVDRHVFFSRASLAVIQRVFALAPERTLVLPHLAEHVKTPLRLPPADDGVVRIAVVGGINVAKGATIVAGMVALAETQRLPVVVELFGSIDRRIDSPHYHDNGPYEPSDLADKLAQRACNAVFLPSIWPETYCYVLDEVIGLGLPVGVFDIGAPAERIRFWPNGFVVPTVTPQAAVEAIVRAVERCVLRRCNSVRSPRRSGW